jgi:hypothetical protein
MAVLAVSNLRPAQLAEAATAARRQCGEPSGRMAAPALEARIVHDPHDQT